MIDNYIKEFIAICEYLKNSEKARLHKGFLIIKKEDLEALLDKNLYETSNNKLKVWKSLQWIETEEQKRITKKVWDPEDKKYKRCIFVVLGVQEALKSLVK